MKIEGEGQLLRIFIGESDHWHGRPLHEAILLAAREQGLAGATVVRDLYTDTLGDPPVDTYDGMIRWDVDRLASALGGS